ncbi:MAG: bifunctional 4-hydroxy-2-oxoglutarate aldolase/2-dehydro-3-deoxy-phosphogluconate aldolase [Clostridia bacterium]|nr:bifunctional 4-hydroxy-2-oxoglutarate aldolase/2-dehydro-3-deoxy-phosphogluconate aldolase [Clostridia bacterium]
MKIVSKVVPVVVLNGEADAKRQLSALSEHLPVAEITFRTDYAEDGIKYCAKNFPNIYVGAGTVINAEQAERAVRAGARFIVSPGLSEKVAAVCKRAGVDYLPGCVTPMEIEAALELGITTVKFFPAQVYGGLKAIKALSAPFPQVRFVPTGGVDEADLAEYLACDRIAFVGGSWMMKGDIAENCKRLNTLLRTL